MLGFFICWESKEEMLEIYKCFTEMDFIFFHWAYNVKHAYSSKLKKEFWSVFFVDTWTSRSVCRSQASYLLFSMLVCTLNWLQEKNFQLLPLEYGMAWGIGHFFQRCELLVWHVTSQADSSLRFFSPFLMQSWPLLFTCSKRSRISSKAVEIGGGH